MSGELMMMRPTRSNLLVLVTLAVAALLAGPVFAGKAETGEPGGSTPMPNEGKEVELSFNPTVQVVVQDGETIQDVFQRLANEARDAAGNLFVVNANLDGPPFGVEILRAGGQELDQLGMRENDPGLQINTLTVNFPGLLARIRRIQEDPRGGTLIVRLNDAEIPVPTDPANDRTALDEQLLDAIRAAGFEAELDPEFLVVLRDLRERQEGVGGGITLVGVESLDPGIVSSAIELALAPVESDNIPTMTSAGFALLMGLLVLAGLLVLRRRGSLAR